MAIKSTPRCGPHEVDPCLAAGVLFIAASKVGAKKTPAARPPGQVLLRKQMDSKIL